MAHQYPVGFDMPGHDRSRISSLEILDLLAPHLRNATRIARFLSRRDSNSPTGFSVVTIRDSTGLSEREAQIAYHAVSGKADREIAATLFVSIATVRTHLRHIYRKLGVSNRSSLCRRLSPPGLTATPRPV
jgi:DNA-binding CsgD family transcriptional regulator